MIAYTISKITDKKGNDKQTSNYPLGTRFLFPHEAIEGGVTYLQYQPRDNEIFKGKLITSDICNIQKSDDDDVLLAETNDSIYHFIEIV